jgi:protein-tyrosine phosphatase
VFMCSSHVLNTTEEVRCHFENDVQIIPHKITYERIEVYDKTSEDLLSHFDRAIQFIGSCKTLLSSSMAQAVPIPSKANEMLSHLSLLMCTATAISNGGKVLVHCAQGRSRSASMVIAYLMKQQHMCFHQALSQV